MLSVGFMLRDMVLGARAPGGGNLVADFTATMQGVNPGFTRTFGERSRLLLVCGFHLDLYTTFLLILH